MEFTILSDIHLGLEKQYLNVPTDKEIKEYLNNFIKKVSYKTEFVVVLGDLIEEHNEIKDKDNINYIINSLKRIKCPSYYVIGNHDIKNISKTDLCKIITQDNSFYSFDKKDLHFIVLFSEEDKNKVSFISDHQINWLKEDLSNTKKNAVIFVHHGLADQNLANNPWFEGKPEKGLISNRKEVRNIIENSKKVIGVFNGHLHWNNKKIHNNIPYFTIHSLSDNSNEQKAPYETYAIVNVKDGKIGVDIREEHIK